MTEFQGMGDTIASQIRRYRLLKNWSVKRLAEECERLGAPQLTASSLANIERGQAPEAKRAARRVLVEELAVLARALDVPPLLLIFPIGQQAFIEVLPGTGVDTWLAAKWWAGEDPWPSRSLSERSQAWFTSAAPIAYYRLHDRIVDEIDEWARAQSALWTLPRGPLDETAKQQGLDLARRLQEVRQHMRRAGVTPCKLSESLTEFLAEQESPHQKGDGTSGRPDQES